MRARRAARMVACVVVVAGATTACGAPRDAASAAADTSGRVVAAPPADAPRASADTGLARMQLARCGPVPDSLDLEAEERLLTNEQGTPLRFATEPVSPSGDWSGRFTHYFDAAGRTIVYERQVSTFASGCAEVLRVFERRALAADGRVIGRTLRLRDKDDRALPDSGRCELEGVPDDSVFTTFAALARARAITR